MKSSKKNYSRTIGVLFCQETLGLAEVVANELIQMGFNVTVVAVGDSGSWQLAETTSLISESDLTSLFNKDVVGDWMLHMNLIGAMRFSRRLGLRRHEITIDIVLPVLPPQLAVKIQSLCDLLSTPYVGCGAKTTTLTADKVLTKETIRSRGLPTKDFAYFTNNEWLNHKDQLLEMVVTDLHYPIRISLAEYSTAFCSLIATDQTMLESAATELFSHGARLLVEPDLTDLFILHTIVMGDFDRPDQLQVSDLIIEPTLKVKSLSLTNTTTSQIVSSAKQCFVAFEGEGIMQVDFLLDPSTDKFYIHDVNSTMISFDPQLLGNNPLLDQVLRELIRLSDERHKPDSFDV